MFDSTCVTTWRSAPASASTVRPAALPGLPHAAFDSGEIRLSSHDPNLHREGFGSQIVSVKIGQLDGRKYEINDGTGTTVGVAWIAEEP